MRVGLRAALLLWAVACLSADAWAQTSANGSIRGYVRDAQGNVLPGAVVTATSPAAPVPYSAVSDSGGYYRLLDLPPGTYTVTAELEGFARFVRPGVVVRAGLNLGIHIDMSIGAQQETVTVTAETPMLEAGSGGQAVNISGDFQRSVPLSARRYWHEFLNVVPGIVSTELGNQPYILHGSSFDAHVMQIDGADAASPAQNTNVYVNLSTDAIADVQIKGSGVDAASPLGTGAVISLVSKSGTNTLSGSAGFTYQAVSWNGNNNPGGTSSAVKAFQPDVSVGGPILRDKWWFFGAYRYRFDEAGVSRDADQLAILRTLVPGFEPFGNKSEGQFPFAKTNVQAGPAHQISFTYQRDKYPRNLSQSTHGSILSLNELGGDLYGMRVSSVWGSSITTKFGFSYNNKGSVSTAAGSGPSTSVNRGAFLSGGRLVGTGEIALLNNTQSSGTAEYSKYTVSGDLTYYRRGPLGTHEVQTGFYFQPRNRVVNGTAYVNGGLVLEEVMLRDANDLASGLIPFHQRVYDTTTFTSRQLTTADYGSYVQDSWRPTSRLTVNVGVRIDRINRDDDLFGVSLSGSTEIGPRLGVNLMLDREQRNSVRASWVRVHEVASEYQLSAGSSTVGYRDLYDLDLNGSFETSFATPGSTAQSRDRIMDPNFHQPYINEWTVGYRRQLPSQVSVDVGLVHRDFRERLLGLDINGIYENGQFLGYRDETQNEVRLITNNTYNWPVYTALELVATKQTGGLQLMASYTRQWRHIDGTWTPNDPASILQPDAFPNDKGIGDTNGNSADGNSLTGTSMVCCNLVLWRDHALRLAAAYQTPWGLSLATSYTYQSPLWAGPTVSLAAAPDPNVGAPTVTLSNGRVVSNPLATTVRFAGPTRGDGQVQIPATHVWNVRVGWVAPFGGRRFDVGLDVFNLPNAGADQFTIYGQSNQTYSPNFGKGSQKQLPRSAQVSARVRF